MNNPTIADAISSLRPNCEWALHKYDGLWWSDDNELPPPTEEELQEELERLQQQWENNQYQRDRVVEYPSIEDLSLIHI